MIDDQIVMGPRPSMDAYYEITTSRGAFHGGIEAMLAQYLIQRGIAALTVELQVSQPGGDMFANGADGNWVGSVCHDCWRPGTPRAGIGEGKAPLLACASACTCETLCVCPASLPLPNPPAY